MKVLSIIVPAYNVEDYIQRCLDSLVYNEDILKYLDIIVVNDGSLDKTLEIVEQYEKRYPGSVRVFDKQNGGHGSTINLGVKEARGKYIKILDGDDWLNIFDLSFLVEKLRKEDADIVITNYKRVLLYDEKEVDFIFTDSGVDVECGIGDAIRSIDSKRFFFRFSMPSIVVKTIKLRKIWGDGLPEKRYYVDQLFVVKVLICADTYVIYDMDIYRHFIGRSEQSIGSAGFYNHRLDHEYVLKEMLRIYKTIKDDLKKEIIKKQIVMMIDTHYQIYFYKRRRLNSERDELIKFDRFLKNHYQEFYKEKKFGINSLRRIR